MRRIAVGLAVVGLTVAFAGPVGATPPATDASCDFLGSIGISPGLTPTPQAVTLDVSGTLSSSAGGCPTVPQSPATLHATLHMTGAFCEDRSLMGDPARGSANIVWPDASSRVYVVVRGAQALQLRMSGHVKSGLFSGDLMKGPLKEFGGDGFCTADDPVTQLQVETGTPHKFATVVFSHS